MALKASRNCWRETWSISRMALAVSLFAASMYFSPSTISTPTNRKENNIYPSLQHHMCTLGVGAALLVLGLGLFAEAKRTVDEPDKGIGRLREVGGNRHEGFQERLASINDTAQGIREIDQVSRQQFLEAFKAINAY